jgi:hypothetical protein
MFLFFLIHLINAKHKTFSKNYCILLFFLSPQKNYFAFLMLKRESGSSKIQTKKTLIKRKVKDIFFLDN